MTVFDTAIAGRRAWIIRGAIGGGLLFLALAFAPAYAQTPGTGLATNYSANADKPIDIEADVLEVDDKKKVAVFKGNVSATQGDFNLRAKELQVIYTSKEKSGGSKKTADNKLVPGGGADLTQIDAKGDVHIKTKGDQTATSN